MSFEDYLEEMAEEHFREHHPNLDEEVEYGPTTDPTAESD